ncbi:hypothetical protein AJ80_04285 [Polytolypa hystricis UAMH7299]|uniref:Deacetylase sirtuin-type domain-containing protein n=1 Tax=Polytolypa hystricis (strain UAMH7299) TaxID=1447883 RepID=A0A2B7YDI1_POLH7|nr:hypothetical protein AJ80_04285 [Polytolypa hystricis UAMH7299]
MTRPLLRIPFTGPLPPPIIFPPSAASIPGAIDAIATFFSAPPSPYLRGIDLGRNAQTVLLTGAGISVASGLADYRGENGTYRRNVTYRPIYYHEFVTLHLARKRYWARSFIGWPQLYKSIPNKTHLAIGELGRKGYISSVITQNVDSFHSVAHPHIPVVELHGYLRSLVCVSCGSSLSRADFQDLLARLNPAWAEYLAKIVESGALETDAPEEQRRKGLRINPDGDVELPNVSYATFRYPPCPQCLEKPPLLPDGTVGKVEADKDGAWTPESNAGILKPGVIMFGESVHENVKKSAEEAIDEAGKLLVLGSSLATFSAWRLVEQAQTRGMSIGVLNVGGIRNEALLFDELDDMHSPMTRVRCSENAELILPDVASMLETVS